MPEEPIAAAIKWRYSWNKYSLRQHGVWNLVWICKRSGVLAWLTSFSSETRPNFVAIARIGRCDAGGTDCGGDKVEIQLE